MRLISLIPELDLPGPLPGRAPGPVPRPLPLHRQHPRHHPGASPGQVGYCAENLFSKNLVKILHIKDSTKEIQSRHFTKNLNLFRMEVIDISGYVAEEKMAIAEKYLIPQVRQVFEEVSTFEKS